MTTVRKAGERDIRTLSKIFTLLPILRVDKALASRKEKVANRLEPPAFGRVGKSMNC